MKTSHKIAFVLGIIVAFATGWLGQRYGRELFAPSAVNPQQDAVADRAAAPPGYWHVARAERERPGTEELTEEEREQLQSVPYLHGSHPASGASGVTVHAAGAAHDGLNLVVSGHGSDALLMDMDGRVLHRWEMSFDSVRGRLLPPPPRIFWRRARLLADGGLLAIYEYAGLVRIDASSGLLWVHASRAHHDLDVDPDGNIYVLTQHHRLNPLTEERNVIADDRITILTPDGEVADEISIFDSFVQSAYATLLDRMQPNGDVFHTNTIEILDGSQQARSRHYRRGNLLVSLRELDTIAIIDGRTKTVAWALTGLWRRQHEPILLDGGSILLFDNYANQHGDESRVLEFDPSSHEVLWDYRGTDAEPFFSEVGGSNQRLPNGNTLIVESAFGRAFEVDRAGKIVWEYLNPHRAGENDELVAALWDVVRVERGSVPSGLLQDD